MARELNPTELDAYDVCARSVAQRVRIQTVFALPPGVGGMTLGRLILVRGDVDRTGTRTLLAHELVHAQQWADQGATRFLTTYVSAYLRNLLTLRNHRRAYLSIPQEVSARLAAGDWADRTQGQAGDRI